MKKLIMALALVLASLVGMPMIASEAVYAEQSTLCEDETMKEKDPQLWEAAGCNTTKNAATVANDILKVVLGFVGLVAVGVIIYGGFLYITSSGDAAKVKRGHDTIKYGLIGLVIALLAFAIVSFVSAVIPNQEKTSQTLDTRAVVVYNSLQE